MLLASFWRESLSILTCVKKCYLQMLDLMLFFHGRSIAISFRMKLFKRTCYANKKIYTRKSEYMHSRAKADILRARMRFLFGNQDKHTGAVAASIIWFTNGGNHHHRPPSPATAKYFTEKKTAAAAPWGWDGRSPAYWSLAQHIPFLVLIRLGLKPRPTAGNKLCFHLWPHSHTHTAFLHSWVST